MYDYGNSYTDTASAVAGGFIGFTLVYMFIVLAVFVVLMIGIMKIFKKLGKPGWVAFIPIYNIWVLLELVGLPGWLSIIPGVNGIVSILAFVKLGQKFGKSTGFILGLIFLSPIFICILGFGPAMPVDGNTSETSTPASNIPIPMQPYVNENVTNSGPTSVDPVPAPMSTESVAPQPVAPMPEAAPVAPVVAPVPPVAPVAPVVEEPKPQFFNNPEPVVSEPEPQINNNVTLPVTDAFNMKPEITPEVAVPEVPKAPENLEVSAPVAPTPEVAPVAPVAPAQAPQAKICPKCGAALDGNAQFCFMCGEKF